ncbi:unnamed protein product, partial [Didymodactylos carnosus]
EGSDRPERESVMFEIDINNPSQTLTSFARIQKLSYFETEDEVLFTIGAIFRIDFVESYDLVWHIKLTLTNGENDEIKVLTDHLMNEVGNLSSTMTLGSILIEMGDYDRAYKYHRLLFEELPPNNDDLAMIYNHLGVIQAHKDDKTTALEYYTKAADIAESKEKYSYLLYIYSNIATVYMAKQDYQKSLSFCKKGLELVEQPTVNNNPIGVANLYRTLGKIYFLTGVYELAHVHFNKALKWLKQTLPWNHYYITSLYAAIADVYFEQGNYKTALHLQKQVLEMEQKCLPFEHPSIGASHNNLGQTYRNLGMYTEAMKNYEITLKIYQTALPKNHTDVGLIYHNIAEIYDHLDDCENALETYQKALDILLVSSHGETAKTYNNIGMIYQKQKDYTQALICYQKALDINSQSLSQDHPVMGITYNNMGTVHLAKNNYSIALDNFKHALKIFHTPLLVDHPMLVKIYNNIALALCNMSDYTSALETLDNGLKMIQENYENFSQQDVALFYSNYGELCVNLKKYGEALDKFKKSLQIHLNLNPISTLSLAAIYKNIGETYHIIGKSNIVKRFYCEHSRQYL